MPVVQSALVVGGGVAGPVAATALAMAGIDTVVCEARPADAASANGIGGSLALEPNGLAALRIIDLDDAVRAAALPITRSVMSIGNKPGREVPAPHGLPPRQLIDRGALHRILRDRAEHAGVRIEHGKKLIRVDEGADGVTAHFADGDSVSAQVLIGADGVHSTVRRLIDPEAPGARYLGMLGFEGLVDDAPDTASVEPGTMTFAFGRRAYYLFWKRPDGRIGWAANLPSPQHLSLKEARAVPAEDWLHTLRTAYADDVPGARLAAETTSGTLQAVGALHIMPPVPHWHRGHMVLVGDAVHAPSNSSGQGASLAIESAIEVARCLRDLPDARSAFEAFERLRRPRVEGIAASAAKVNSLKAPGPLVRAAMPLLMRLLMKTAMRPEKAFGPAQRHRIDWDARLPADVIV
jgi:2-polyprenyl-6-methoxyphenol hydroxylase-like FAD-dependent oxidoreductase